MIFITTQFRFCETSFSDKILFFILDYLLILKRITYTYNVLITYIDMDKILGIILIRRKLNLFLFYVNI